MKIFKILFLSLLLALPLAAFSADQININTADKETLMNTIKGVGDKRADAIIEYRDANGPFSSVDDLANVKGIGQKMIDDNRDMLTVSD